jgi:2-isopropylmalate synthase
MDMPHRPELLDSTLREGEQAAGVSFTPEAKVKIAKRLDTFGVEILEMGHPAVSPQLEQTCKQIAGLGLRAQTLAHSRARIEDVDLARRTGADWVGIFHAVRDEALRERFNIDLPQALERIQGAIEYAKAHGLRVRFTPEDTVRTSRENLQQAVIAARDAGADRISIADTTGSAIPATIADLVGFVRQESGLDVHVHCHNDLGLAVANAHAGLEAGARVVDVSVNGLGERTGIVDLATMATLLVQNGTQAPWDLTALPDLCQLVAEESGIGVHALAPVVGANAFSHKAGLHVAAVARDPRHFEAFPAELVGRTREVTVDRYSGIATLRHRCNQLGLHAEEEVLQQVLAIIKAQETRRVEDEALVRMVEQCRPGAVTSSVTA